MGRMVEGRVAAHAVVDASRWVVLVILAGAGHFGALFAEDTELFWGRMLNLSMDCGGISFAYLCSERLAIRPRVSGPGNLSRTSCWRKCQRESLEVELWA